VKSTTDRILAGLLVALVATLGWVVVRKDGGSLHEPVTEAGDKAPKFEVVTDSGKKITPTDFGGKLLVLNFWAAWCQPCVQEAPSLEAFHQAYGPKGVVVLGISVDKNKELYDRFKDKFGLTFKTYRDQDWNIAADFGTFQLPETYVIDQSGRVVEKVIAAQNWMEPKWLASVDKHL
jgi:peroxiredoxin